MGGKTDFSRGSVVLVIDVDAELFSIFPAVVSVVVLVADTGIGGIVHTGSSKGELEAYEEI